MRIPLPTDYTVFRFLVPSLGQEKKFRPFTVKENKALLAAQSTDDETVMVDTLKQVISNCCLEDDFDVDKLAIFDAEYLLIKLRGVSVGQSTNLIVTCGDAHDGFPEETRKNEIVLDLDNLEIVDIDKYNPHIRLSDSMVVNMKAPTLDLLKRLRVEKGLDFETDYSSVLHNICIMIDNISTSDEVISGSDLSIQDLSTWLESLTEPQFMKLYNYFINFPKCRIKLDWTCPTCGKRNVQYLEGISYFF